MPLEKCNHRYSRAMNQEYPRKCVLCGEPEPVSESGSTAFSETSLRSFYEWYLEANAASRAKVLNELQRRLGLTVEKYPEQRIYDERFVIWYSGMEAEKIRSAYQRYIREVLDKFQGKLDIKDQPKPGELL
jgi:hypothetical protein